MPVLVTGATGCLGGALVRRLARDGFDVTASGRSPLAGVNLRECGIAFRPAELSDRSAIDALVAGHDTVVHCGGLSSLWGPASAFERANVEGTRNVVDAALRHDVRRLVFVSTPSLYFDFRERFDVTEDEPLPRRPVNAYAASKAAAERIVREALGRGLSAAIVRPRAIIGPGDTALLPRLLRVAKRGLLPLIDGGRAVIDLTYVDNVVDALVALMRAPGVVDGKTYNITNGEPLSVAALFSRIVAALKLRVHFVSVPFTVAYAAATALETTARLLPGCPEPPLTRYSVGLLARSQTLSIAAARRDFDYLPRISLEEGIQRAAGALRPAHAR